MLKTFFLSEIKYVLKQPLVYIFFGLFALLAFGGVSSDSITIGGSVGNVLRNAPHVITIYTTVMTIFGLLVATAFFNNAALRDHNNEFNEILFSTPISKPGYFFGRFFGALILATIPLLGVFIGFIMGAFISPIVGWIPPERFGAFHLNTFINNYFLFILPNMFIAGAIIYALANKWKSSIISFVGTLIIIMAYVISGRLMSDIDNEIIGALTDIFGTRTYGLSAKYYTAAEKNTLNPGFSGLLLVNRVFWIAMGILILAISFVGFSFKEKNKKVKIEKAGKQQKDLAAIVKPKTSQAYAGHIGWRQFKSFFKISFLSIIKSTTLRILFIFSAIMLIVGLYGGYDYYGLQSYPLTYKLLDSIDNNASLFMMIILVFFSGEIIWRDRSHKINEVIDATPHASFISLLAKTLSLVATLTVLHAIFVVYGVMYQLFQGYTRIELNVYFLDFLYTKLPQYLTWSGILVLVQVVLNNRYMGYFVSLLVIFIWELALTIFDIESNMLAVGGAPALLYSDMNSFGPGLLGAMWFNLYWIMFALLCLILAGILWNRGTGKTLLERIKVIRKQISRPYGVFAGAALLVWILIAGFVYYNTQILNPYDTQDESDLQLVTFEKKYKKYENTDHLKLTKAKYFIDIFPNQRDVKTKTLWELTNETKVTIDSLHFITNEDWHTEFKIPDAELVLEDETYGYLIYKLNTPVNPGETIAIEIAGSFVTQGFRNNLAGIDAKVIKNGTFFNNFNFSPSIGYSPNMELSDPNKRKKHGLPVKKVMPQLAKDSTKHHMMNYLSEGRSDFIPIESVISTASDQTAIAPGSLIRKWNENGRSYFHYKLDYPSQHFYSFVSGRYEKATRKWNGIDIEVYHDKKHNQNIEMMLNAIENALDYYTKNYGPYQHRQCRIIEFPRYSTFAQAYPGTMPYAESFGFVVDLEDKTKNNIIDAVIAHEISHQWWAHQLVGANMQGGTFLSESFAEYSSLMTMRNTSKSPMQMREFIKYNHDRYLRGRSGEKKKELPLYKVENQQYVHYGKGSIVLYALQDYIGEDKVNLALRNFLNEYSYKKPPYPTSLDFLEYLEPQIPDSLKYLVDDWFKEITLYDNRLKNATYEKKGKNKYRVSVDIESYKIKADSIGNETKVPMDDWIDIGFFLDEAEEQLYHEERIRINKNETSLKFELDSLPVKAAIDPRMLLIDRIYNDNIKRIQTVED
ncbi:ABC transporter permease/M1 family aminopeptidase [Allomuricauda sp. SCSIO 65647]|uniref:ABC transporter permease/M1 family aminopeptidase n=1 Tax=Allomuricauda sp. SCSIO 65647 TaxID=2908843 RepID=UPI001F218E4D|nr:M1 family aminopeptidase [Muricauda sp. SCSIO 65647]UJH67039.1 hypothetical protein L0P89_13925 [Muricauda sp. SCSIO 65647]